MKKKVIAFIFILCVIFSQYIYAYEDLTTEVIRQKQLEFASQYPYKDGDAEKTFSLYSTDLYTSGSEYTKDGVEYECPAIYIESCALDEEKFVPKMENLNFVVNDISKLSSEFYILHRERILVPVAVFSELDCETVENKNTYVTTIIKDDTILEIIPNMIGMRINQADGYYIPLVPCARIVNDILYVPLRAVAEELGFDVDWDDAANTATVSNSQITAIIETSNN